MRAPVAAGADCVAARIGAERLQQHPVEPEIARDAKLLDADRISHPASIAKMTKKTPSRTGTS